MDQEKVTQSGEMEIDLLELLHLLRQKIWIVLAALLAGGILTGAATYFLIKPTYEASALLYVVSASNDSVVNLSDLQIGPVFPSVTTTIFTPPCIRTSAAF